MKEKFLEFIQWVRCNETLCNLYQKDLVRGIVIGAAAVLVLLILFWILKKLCCRRKKCSSVNIAGEGGSIVVSIAALAGALRYELSSFTQFGIRKIALFNGKKGYVLEIAGKFFPHKSSAGATELFAGVEKVVKEKMFSLFGIDNISEIKLKIEACPLEENKEADTEDIL